MKDGCLSILGYVVHLIFEKPIKMPGKHAKKCVLEYPSGINTLKCHMHCSNMKYPPPYCPTAEGVPLLATSSVIIISGYQVINDSRSWHNKPHLFPGILDSSHKDVIQLIVANLTPVSINVSSNQVVGYSWPLNAPDVLLLHPFGTFHDFNLPEVEPQVLSLLSAENFPKLSPVQQKEVLDLIYKFADIFAKDSTNYGLAKGVIHQIDTVDAPLFQEKGL
ncbi:hypothetical protein DSO57_1002832 [Entomophthora muscae]|uniref:Uncharacterized protein n=1 Tax=Entomophthora muscae TaxID=34485 RepID=A0ACC2RZL0_9FUNG|nr:hypothetical protein DSO57_1002832 [Entomophthora muscae]